MTKRWIFLLLLLSPTATQAQSLDSLRTDAVRSRGFIRGAETQATKVINQIDTLIALGVSGDTVFVSGDTVVVTDTVTVGDTVFVTDTIASDTVRLKHYPVRGPMPKPIVGTEWGVEIMSDSSFNVYWRDACPIYHLTEPQADDPWSVEVASGQYSARSPCPPILQDAWHVYGGRNETEFNGVYRSDTTNVSFFGSGPGDYWICVNRLYGFRPELAERDDSGALVLEPPEILALPGVILPEQSCKSFTLP